MSFLPNRANSRIKRKRFGAFNCIFGGSAPPPLTPPVRFSAPGIAGVLQVGNVVVVDPLPGYSGNPLPVPQWRWQMRPNGGGTITTLQTGGSLTLTDSHVGMQLRLQDMASNSQGSTNWTNGPWSNAVAAAPAPSRPLIASTESIGMSAHSFLAEPSGSMAWGGPIRLNYIGGSNVTERWDANGLDRTGDYSGALIVATFGDFEVGTYPPDSANGIDELQHLYWYALTAQAKGCELMIVYPIWTPPGPPTSWDADTMAKTIAKVDWLNARPEITLTVVTAPTPILARQIETYYAPTSIWRDGLHMYDPPVPGMRAIRGMGLMVHSMLTGAIYAGAIIDAEDGIMRDMAWAAVRDYACTGLGGATVIAPYPVGSDPLPNPLPLPGSGDPEPIPDTVINPPFATALNWMQPGSMSHSPTIDVLKIAPELASYGGTAPDMDWNALQAAGHITQNGTIISIPPNKDMIASSALNRFPAGSGYTGRIRLFYTGAGEIYTNGVDYVDADTHGHIDFDFTANGNNSVFFSVWRVDSPITFVAMVRHEDLPAYYAGKVFNEKWLKIIRNERMIRFRQYMNSGNYVGEIDWNDRYLPERMTWVGPETTSQGVPVEIMCDICNEIGVDPWFPLVASVSDSYVTNFATMVRDRLNPVRRVHFELSDKVWDGANYATAGYFRNLAQVNYGDDSIESCMDAYGGRSAEVFAVLRTVFAGQLSRLRTVMQGWTPRPNLTVNAFTAPLWRALPGKTGQPEPWTLATDYAVHSNFDGALRDVDTEAGFNAVTIMQGWIDTLTDAEIYIRMDQCFRGTHPVINGGYNLANIQAAYQNTKSTLAAYLTSINVISYEGICHLVLPRDKMYDPDWRRVYHGFVRTQLFTDFMADSMNMWRTEWPSPSNVFMRSAECRYPDENNMEGLTWTIEDTGPDNLQYTYWNAQRSVHQGETGRGASAFVGTAELL